MKQFKTIHARIFLSLSVAIVVLIFVGFCFFGVSFSNTLLQKEYDSIQQISGDISGTIDEQFLTVRATGAKIYTSNQFKDLFYKELDSYADTFVTGQELWQIVRTVIGAVSPYSRILCVRSDGKGYQFDDMFSIDACDKLLYRADRAYMEAKEYPPFSDISAPHYIRTFSTDRMREVVTLYTRFSKKISTRKDNLLAISIDYDWLFKRAMELSKSEEQQIFIYSNAGILLFPQDVPADALHNQVYTKFQEAKAAQTPNGILENAVGSSYICAYNVSEISGYIVLVARPTREIYRPLTVFFWQLTLMGLAAMTCAVILAYLMAKRLVNPLELLKQSIRSYDLDSAPPEEDLPLGSGIDEIESLNREYVRMRRRVRRSLDAVVAAHTHETQSRLLALQAQMNPHFLYNTLSAMSILAEEGACGEITDMCAALSGMLRYISTDSFSLVRLTDELNHTRAFIRLMQIRYQEMLRFRCDVPDEMLQLQLPRLCVQPLVENALKYGIDGEPPWQVSVTGEIEGEHWRIQVRDSGPGIPEETIAALYDKMHALDILTYVPDSGLNGVGLVNIYMRLLLVYGEESVFSLSNDPEGGACVTIGGNIYGRMQSKAGID